MTKEDVKNCQLLGDAILVKRLPLPDLVKGSGIWLPDSAKEKPQLGEVLNVGNGPRCKRSSKRKVMDIEVGSWVLFGRFVDYRTFWVDDEEFLILSEFDHVYAEIRH